MLLKLSYLGFPCVNCKSPIRAFTILAGMENPRTETEGVIDLHCEQCGSDGTYQWRKLTRFEEPQMHF